MLVQTVDHSVIEFDQGDQLQRVWWRDDPDFGRAEVPLMPGAFVDEDRVLGAAMGPADALVVHVRGNWRAELVSAHPLRLHCPV